MFWRRTLRVSETDREAGAALFAEIMEFGKRNSEQLAVALERQHGAPAPVVLDARPRKVRKTVVRISSRDGEHHQIEFSDLERAMRQARVLHGCGYQVSIHHRARRSESNEA